MTSTPSANSSQFPTRPPAQEIASRKSSPFRQVARLLLFLGAAILLALVLLRLGPTGATIGLGGAVVVGVGMAAWRGGLRRWFRPYRRRDIFLLTFSLLAALLFILPRTLAGPLLAIIMIGWGGVVVWQFIPRLRAIWMHIQPWLATTTGRWLLAVLTALVVGRVMVAMPRAWHPVMMGVLLIGALPVICARVRRSVIEKSAVVRGLTLIAIQLVILGYHELLTARRYIYHQAALLLLLALAALVVAVQINQRTTHRIELPRPALTPFALGAATRWRGYAFWTGLALMIVFAEANGRILGIPALVHMSVHVQFGLLALAIVLLTAGLGGLQWPRIDRQTALIIGAVTVIGFVIRAYGLESLMRQYVDELSFAWGIQDLWAVPNTPLVQPMRGFASFPYIFPYWQAQMVEWFGRNLVGLRAISVILGTLNIPAMYLLARALFDRSIALIALVLLATFPPHIHFSRIGLNNIMDPLLMTLALGFVARGVMHNRRADYVLGGVFLGLSHYFYEGGRLLLTPLALVWLLGLVLLWRPRINWRALLLVFFTALIIAMPIYYTLSALNRTAAPRLTDYQVTLDAAYWSQINNPHRLQFHIQRQVIDPLLVYIKDFEGAFFYRGPQGLILWFLVPVFLLGIGWAVAHWRRPGPLLILLLCLSATAGMSFLAQPNLAARYGITFPALILFLALGLRYVPALLWPVAGRTGTLALAVVVLILAVVHTHYYFNTHLPVFNEQHRAQKPYRDAQDAIYRSLHLPPGTHVVIISHLPPDAIYTLGIADFMSDDLAVQSVAAAEVTRDYLKMLQRGVNYAFFVEPGQDEALRLLKTYFYLLPPQNSPYDILPHQQFPLYYAPYLRDYSDALLAQLDRVIPADHHQPARR